MRYTMKKMAAGKFLGSILSLLLAIGSVQANAQDVSDTPNFNKEIPPKIREEQKKNTEFLLAHVLKKAKALEDVYGDFAPYGAVLFISGKVQYVWLAKPGQTVNDPVKAIPIVRGVLEQAAMQGNVLASAVVYKYGSVADPQLNVELEYVTGYSKLVGTKYTKDKDNKVIWGAAGQKDFDINVFAFLYDKKEAVESDKK